MLYPNAIFDSSNAQNISWIFHKIPGSRIHIKSMHMDIHGNHRNPWISKWISIRAWMIED